MNYRLPIALLSLIFIPLNVAQAQATLEEVLAEVKALKGEVEKLEDRISTLEGAAPVAAQNTAVEQSLAPSEPTVKAGPPKQDKHWYQKFGISLEHSDKEAKGKWTIAENWEKLEEGMKEDEVFAILGEPTRTLETIKKRVDVIHIYRGLIHQQTLKVQGKVKIYRGKVVSIEMPELLL
tara:strand:- start:307 stop:843 length:537 start_codon:yes stop_codon:yes gene_type:complete